MILIRDIRLLPGENQDQIVKKASEKLHIDISRIQDCRILRRSLDARRKNDIHYHISAAVSVKGNEKKLISRLKNRDISEYRPAPELVIPRVSYEGKRPVVVGFGPAGMFAALVLARAGLCPVVVERGQPVEERTKAVERFRRTGVLDPESNVQFGEGGAGTFSDGKLNTGTHDGRIPFVLKTFYEHGADETVLYDAKPHIGTDILVKIVKNIREEILSLGGEILFETKMERIISEDDAVCGIRIQNGSDSRIITCDRLILAIGHSARDTFENLHNQNVPMERKAFSMGVRIEHKQKEINKAQYGTDNKDLPPADYSLNVHLPDGSSAYTFCMCPGGVVFAAASEREGVCTNGMSYSARDGENANSALLVTLKPEDFPGEGILAGMEWQRAVEKRAFEYGKTAGAYYAPAQLAGDFISGIPSSGPGSIVPSYLPGVRWGNLHEVLPEKICSVLKEAIPEFDRKLCGFAVSDAVLTGPETRSSSPVRILREENCQSALKGLYPCGEGAGYAGGITSAAVDGIRCAEKLIETLEY